ncbi:V-type proton ATPase subunit G [Psidium guajava]|nr:V-type proton ATPase subunit G [Psidium guajava]
MLRVHASRVSHALWPSKHSERREEEASAPVVVFLIKQPPPSPAVFYHPPDNLSQSSRRLFFFQRFRRELTPVEPSLRPNRKSPDRDDGEGNRRIESVDGGRAGTPRPAPQQKSQVSSIGDDCRGSGSRAIGR